MLLFSYALEKYNTMVFLKTAFANATRRGAWLALALLLASSSLRADDVQDAARLLRAGQSQQALEQINKALAAAPNDAQARFMKGTILAELGNSKEATEIFLKLTQDYPELPEPYNNLAVLYAAQGQYDKARAALERSLHTHPSYATAYENLTEVYAKLANQAYDKALQLETAGSSPKNNKLALVRELVPVAPRAVEPLAVAVASAPTSATDVAPITAVAAGPAAEQRPAAASPAPQQQAAAAHPADKIAARDKIVIAAAKPSAPTAPSPSAAQAPQVAAPLRTAPPQSALAQRAGTPQRAVPSPQSEVVETVLAWAAAWSRKDAKAYLAFYAKQFKPPRGEPRAHWEQARRSRIVAPKSISVTIQSPKVEVRGNSTASVKFRQTYRSDVFSGNSTKTLTLVKSDGRWLITEESVN
jgi:Flp pilus assembly protein TadD